MLKNILGTISKIGNKLTPRQLGGNIIDVAGTKFNLPEFGLSEKIAGKNTVNTGRVAATPITTGVIGSVSPYTVSPKTQKVSNNKLPMYGPKDNPEMRKQLKNLQSQKPSGASQLGLSGGSSVSSGANADAQARAEQEAQARADEERRLIAEQERKNEEFRGQLGGQYGELRGKFGNILGAFNEKLSSLPAQLKQLGQQYKTAIGEQQGQRIGQVGQKREQVQTQQKEGLSKIYEDVRNKVKQGSGRLGALGMASSAAGMFQKAIQNEANKSARDLLTQAANNYKQLDNEETQIKSAYKTMIDDLDAQEATNIKNVQDNANKIIADINERLQKSGEYEKLDKEGLQNVYLQELTNRFEEAKRESENMKQQAEQWRLQNESAIRNLKNQMVQDFIPKEITSRELEGIKAPQKQTNEVEGGLNPRLLRRVPEDNEDIETPANLVELTRRLRERNNQ